MPIHSKLAEEMLFYRRNGPRCDGLALEAGWGAGVIQINDLGQRRTRGGSYCDVAEPDAGTVPCDASQREKTGATRLRVDE